MINRLKTRLFHVLEKRKTNFDEELYLFTLLMTVGVASLLLLLFYVPFQLSIHSVPLLAAGLVCQAFSVGTLVLVYHKHYDIAGVIQVSTISVFNLFALLVLGGGYYIILYFITGLLMILIIPFKNRRIHPIFFGIHLLVTIFAFYLEVFHLPVALYRIDRWLFSLSNLMACFFSMLAFVLLEKGIRSFLDSFRLQQLQDLRTQANIDPLTGLYNRRFADAYFEKLQAGRYPSKNHCVAIADLDDFKKVNDTYGHDTGDVVLQRVSEIMHESIRKSDYLFRWGGEEFLLVISGATLPEGHARLEAIRQKIKNVTIQHGGNSIQITITIGLAVLDPKNIANSIKQCDEKLYEGKRSGKNIVVF